MPEFHYRMADAHGQLRQGTMTAATEDDLASRLRDAGTTLISARAQPVARHGKPPRGEVVTFTRHLCAALQGGIPILDGIRSYADGSTRPATTAVLNDVAARIAAGHTLAQSLADAKPMFPPLYVHMVEAGEETGKLDTILADLADYLEWREQTTRDLRQATYYPAFLMALVLALIFFLLSFVMPRFLGVFAGASDAIPAATHVLMAVGELSGRYWPVLILGGMGAAVAFVLARRNAQAATWLDARLLQIPLVGPVVQSIHLSQMTYALGLLLGSGVNLSRSLMLSAQVVPNLHLRQLLTRVDRQVHAGQTLAGAFRSVALLPPLVQQMVAVGEDSGSLGASLDRATRHLRTEVQARLRGILTILEPAITVFMGVFVGGIALLIFYTLYRVILSMGAHP